MGEHQHYFARAVVRDIHGAPLADGRRCSCGMETVGDGPLGGLNANVVRAGQGFNESMAAALREVSDRLRAARDQVREP